MLTQQFGPHASFARFLAAMGLLLVVLVSWLEPSASAGLGLGARFAFWSLHVGTGLVVMALIGQWVVRLPFGLNARPWLATVLTGVIGSVLYTQIEMGLEAMFPEQDPDQVVTSGWWMDALLEYSELVVPLTVCWALLNGPKLLRLSALQFDTARATRQTPTPITAASPTPPRTPAESCEAPESSSSEFMQLLPDALGTDIIAVSSDLHYLHVYTPLGKTMVLHNLRDAVAMLGPSGEQVHRSHWVAYAHVSRLSRRSRALHCVMSNGMKVPVSRRRQRPMIERFGRDTQLAGAARSTRPSSSSAVGERSA